MAFIRRRTKKKNVKYCLDRSVSSYLKQIFHTITQDLFTRYLFFADNSELHKKSNDCVTFSLSVAFHSVAGNW